MPASWPPASFAPSAASCGSPGQAPVNRQQPFSPIARPSFRQRPVTEPSNSPPAEPHHPDANLHAGKGHARSVVHVSVSSLNSRVDGRQAQSLFRLFSMAYGALLTFSSAGLLPLKSRAVFFTGFSAAVTGFLAGASSDVACETTWRRNSFSIRGGRISLSAYPTGEYAPPIA